MRYRPEIDGLRALAVLPVIFFHAGLPWLSGGFVGVDIFFVISGYLITTIILADLSAGTFSFKNFYERRARRILPALVLVMAICIPLAWMLLAPLDMRSFAQSLVATSLFASNILFFKTSGYFESAAEMKPLLHTWSLAVEEQYYLLFPALLYAGWRLSRQHLPALLALLMLASLALAQWAFDRSPLGVFYLLPTRVWELLIGACLAYDLASRHADDSHGRLAGPWSALGLIMILGAVIAFDRNTPAPGLWTLMPTLGAALIIAHAHADTWVGRWLGSRALVGIGLISYSAYLWHQPLLAFVRYASVQPPEPWMLASVGALSLVVAYGSWRWVERPFRSRDQVSRTGFATLVLAASSGIVGFGLAGHVTKGFPGRLPVTDAEVAELVNIADPASHFGFKEVLRNGRCHSVPASALETNGCMDIRQRTWLLIGDSYAANLHAGLDAVRSARHPEVGIVQATDNNGPPFDIPGFTDERKTLAEAAAERIALAQRLQPEKIVITWMIDGINGIGTPEASADALDAMIDRLLAVSPDSSVLVVGPFPKWAHSLQKQMINYHLRTGRRPPTYMRDGLVTRDREWDAYLARRIPRPQVAYVSAIDLLCTPAGCLTHLEGGLTDLVAVDWGHLSRKGSIHLAQRLEARAFADP